MRPERRTRKRGHVRWAVAALVVGSMAGTHGLTAQEEAGTEPPWSVTLIMRASYADYAAGPGAAQSAMVYLSRDVHRWIFSVGHNRLFGSDGYGFGASYRHSWGRFRLGGGLSSGVNVRGSLYPKYHAGVTAGTNIARGVPVSLSFSRRRSASSRSYTDRIGLGAQWWAPGPWLFTGSAVYSMGHPGDTHGWSGGAGITYMLWRRLHVGVNARYGDGSYMLLPGQNVVEYTSWSYGGTVTKYLNPDLGLSLSVHHTDYYDGTSFRVGLSRRW